MNSRFILIVSLILPVVGLSNTNDLPELSRKLIELRSDIELLSQQSQNDSRLRQTEVETLLQRRSELQSQILKEELRQAQLQTKLNQEQPKVARKGPATKADRMVLAKAAGELEKWIKTSLPFRRDERLSALKVLTQKIQSEDVLEPLASQLWTLVDKELKLSQENAFEIMDLDLPEGRSKAQVVRLGLHQMYFMKANGEVGQARRSATDWQLVTSTDAAESKAIQRICQRFSEQKGQGYFELPGLNQEAL